MRKGWAIGFSVLVVTLIGLSLGACLQFIGEGGSSVQEFTTVRSDRGNALTLSMQIVETNLAREQMRLAVVPVLNGRLAAGSPRLAAREIELTLATVNGPRTIMMKPAHHIEPFDIDVALSDGEVLLYPMDSYTSWIEAEAMLTASAGAAAEKIPLVIALNPRNHAVHVAARLGRQTELGDTIVRLQISRLVPIVVFTWFMAAVMAVIALAVMAMVITVIMGRRAPELSMMVWSTALLFALPAVRNNLPGAPALGALIHYCAFFWAEALVGLSMLVLLGLWFTHREGGQAGPRVVANGQRPAGPPPIRRQ